jgi:arylsulfatase A-like enzyme
MLTLAVAAGPVGADDTGLSDELRVGPNVLFVLIDTLRADHLGAYGYARETSPNLDALARDGVRFARVRSQASWTKPSMASLWTGVHPSGTGVLRFSHALPERATLPAEILKRAGYRTAGLWRNGWVASNFGFGRGFDLYLRPPPGAEVTRRGGRPLPTDLDLTRSAAEFLRTFRDQPFLLYLHFMDVHQYVYDQESARFGTGDAYDNAIHWVDRNVGALVAELERLGLRERTLVVVAADHGEEFDDHRSEGHGRTLYAEVTHTPLILSQPGRLPVGRVVEERVQNLDLWPTLLDLLGLAPLPEAQGRSLVALMEGAGAESEPTPTFSQIDRVWGRSERDPLPLVSVTDGDWRLIHPVTSPGADRLFDLSRDPREQEDLAAQHPERVAALRVRIDALLALPPPWDAAPEVELDAMRLEQLRALGYLGVGQGEPEPLPAPTPPLPDGD